MKEIVQALAQGVLNRDLFYESVGFAFKDKPRDYREYLKKSLEYAEEYSMDAIPISLRLKKEFIKPEEAIRELSKISSSIGLGLTYSAPFTRTAREIGPTKFLSEIKDDKDFKERLNRTTSKACRFIRRFESLVDFIILIDPMSCNDLISPEYFKNYVHPSYVTLSDSTTLPIILHMPGKILENLSFILNSGIKGLQPIDKNNLREVIEKSKGKLKIMGNIRNNLFINGDYSELNEEFRRCSEAHQNKPWIVHTDFWIPKRADPKRVKYLSGLINS